MHVLHTYLRAAAVTAAAAATAFAGVDRLYKLGTHRDGRNLSIPIKTKVRVDLFYDISQRTWGKEEEKTERFHLIFAFKPSDA